MEKFNRIKSAYKELHDEFLRKNPILVKYMGKGVWAPSLPKELYKIFKKTGGKEKTFLDLGSGDGIAVMTASLFFKQADGIEFEKEFYDISENMKKKLGIKNVNFIFDDFFNIDFGKYDVIFIAPDKEFTLKLENKINSEMKKGKLIVYSSIFKPKTLRLADKFETAHFDVGVYERNK
jgi:predicted O-methyltransferase YrrM